MSENTNRQIRTNLEMAGQILKFHMRQEVNAHGCCTLEGTIADGCRDDFAKENSSGRRVEIRLSHGENENEGKDTILFVGIIGELSIFQDGSLYRFKIKLYSATFLMDLQRKSRSFQDTGMTYGRLAEEILAGYDGGDVIDRLSDGKKLEEPLVQYQETDWEFLKRAASRLGGGLLAACEFESPKVFLGAKKETHVDFPEPYAYTQEKDLLRYREISSNGCPGFMESDAVSFSFDAGEYYEIGSPVDYRGAQFYIAGVEAKLCKGEILFCYRLKTEKGMGSQPLCANGLSGASIQAEVLETVRDKVKVKLDIDDEQDPATAWEFPYQTMYTAEGAGGWYCMPEKGDKVMVYFPNSREADAVAVSSSRQPGREAAGTGDPQIKYFRTIHGKEIRFTPDAVEIICEDRAGGETIAKITLRQDEGIELYSRAGITFASGKGIRLEAEEEIEIAASERISLHCKKSRIRLDTKVDISGPDVRIN